MRFREGGQPHGGADKSQAYGQPKDDYPDLHPRRKPDVLGEELKSDALEVRSGLEYVGHEHRGLFARKPFKTGDAVFTFDGRKELLSGNTDSLF